MIGPLTTEYFLIFFVLWIVIAGLFVDGVLNGAVWAKGYDRKTGIPAVRLRRGERPVNYFAWMGLYGAMTLGIPAVVTWNHLMSA